MIEPLNSLKRWIDPSESSRRRREVSELLTRTWHIELSLKNVKRIDLTWKHRVCISFLIDQCHDMVLGFSCLPTISLPIHTLIGMSSSQSILPHEP